MWTDEQLLAQGWTKEQIATHRAEEASKGIAQVAESLVSEPLSVESISTEPSPAMFAETFEASNKTTSPLTANSIVPAILLVTMLVLVPFSLYSISNAEGTQGPPGDIGTAGTNGSDGSSFHLVTSVDALPQCNADVNNQIFFIAVDAAFQVCQNSIWTPIDLTGQSGLNGTDGVNGADGTNGTDGADGINGADGADGEAGGQWCRRRTREQRSCLVDRHPCRISC
jgi:hypothetical protein